MIHYGMPYDLIQGQGHIGPKIAKMVNFQACLLRWYASTGNQKANGEDNIYTR